ncbi:MAG: hypothetical protein ACAI25_18055 [Planctomycetota bacterium]
MRQKPKRKTQRVRRAHLEPKERLLAIRIPESLFGRLDVFCEAMRIEVPWVRMTRSDAVRWLLTVQLQHDLGASGATPFGGMAD